MGRRVGSRHGRQACTSRLLNKSLFERGCVGVALAKGRPAPDATATKVAAVAVD